MTREFSPALATSRKSSSCSRTMNGLDFPFSTTSFKCLRASSSVIWAVRCFSGPLMLLVANSSPWTDWQVTANATRMTVRATAAHAIVSARQTIWCKFIFFVQQNSIKVSLYSCSLYKHEMHLSYVENSFPIKQGVIQMSNTIG